MGLVRSVPFLLHFALCFALCFALLPSAVSSVDYCQQGWAYHDNSYSCFKAFNTSMTFENALDVCYNQHPYAHVVTLYTEEENTFTGSLIPQLENMWIGLVEYRTSWEFIDFDVPLQNQGCYIDNNQELFPPDGYNPGLTTRGACDDYCRSRNQSISGLLENYLGGGSGITGGNGPTAACGCADTITDIFTRSITTVDCNTQNDNKVVIRNVDGVSFNAWGNDQPQQGNGRYKGCLTIRDGTSLKFSSKICSERKPFICRFNTVDVGCPAGGVSIINDVCLRRNNTQRNWFDARAVCMREGGMLLAFDSKNEFDALESNNVAMGALFPDNDPVWTGGVSGVWMWEYTYEIPLYNEWDWESNPSSGSAGQCMVRRSTGKWQSRDCNNKLPFVCRYYIYEGTTEEPLTTDPTDESPEPSPTYTGAPPIATGATSTHTGSLTSSPRPPPSTSSGASPSGTQPSSDSQGVDIALVAGASAGALLLLIIVILIVVFCRLSRRKNAELKSTKPSMAGSDNVYAAMSGAYQELEPRGVDNHAYLTMQDQKGKGKYSNQESVYQRTGGVYEEIPADRVKSMKAPSNPALPAERVKGAMKPAPGVSPRTNPAGVASGVYRPFEDRPVYQTSPSVHEYMQPLETPQYNQLPPTTTDYDNKQVKTDQYGYVKPNIDAGDMETAQYEGYLKPIN